MYPIYRYKSYRPRTDYILLIPSVNFIKSTLYIDPIVRRGNYKFTWEIWQKYFVHDMFLKEVPCHYYCELLDTDYVIYKGCPDQKRSTYLEEMVKNGIINPEYKNAIVIMLQDNFYIDMPDRRMWDQLNSKCISQLLRQYNLSPNRIKIIDECLTDNWKENLELSGLKYEITESKWYNKDIMRLSAEKYFKF